MFEIHLFIIVFISILNCLYVINLLFSLFMYVPAVPLVSLFCSFHSEQKKAIQKKYSRSTCIYWYTVEL